MKFKKKKKYNLILGRHCVMNSPDYLLGSFQQAFELGANTLTFFLGSPHSMSRKDPFTLKAKEFREELEKKKWDINKVVAHGPYITNLANLSNKEVFFWSVIVLKQEMKLMEQLGIRILVIHPGSSLKESIWKGLDRLIVGLDSILSSCTKGFIALETMSNRNRIGGSFSHLAYVINRVKHSERVGVCLDTCHLYAAGYDIKNCLEDVIEEFNNQIGLKKLWVIHINDSQKDLGSGIDRHANVGKGKIGLQTLKKIVHHPLFDNIPKFLETPWISKLDSAKELELLFEDKKE